MCAGRVGEASRRRRKTQIHQFATVRKEDEKKSALKVKFKITGNLTIGYCHYNGENQSWLHLKFLKIGTDTSELSPDNSLLVTH